MKKLAKMRNSGIWKHLQFSLWQIQLPAIEQFFLSLIVLILAATLSFYKIPSDPLFSEIALYVILLIGMVWIVAKKMKTLFAIPNLIMVIGILEENILLSRLGLILFVLVLLLDLFNEFSKITLEYKERKK